MSFERPNWRIRVRRARDAWEDGVFDSWSRAREVTEAHFDAAVRSVETRRAEVEELRALDDATRRRVADMVALAYQEKLPGRTPWQSMRKYLIRSTPVFPGVVVAGVACFVLLRLLQVLLTADYYVQVDCLTLVIVVMGLRALVRAPLTRQDRRLADAMDYVFVAAAAVGALSPAMWSPRLAAWGSHHQIVLRYGDYYFFFSQAIQPAAVWLLKAVYGAGCCLLLYRNVMNVSSSWLRSPSGRRATYAVLVRRLFQLTLLVERQISGPPDHGDPSVSGVATYMMQPTRQRVIEQLEGLAVFVEGPWRVSMSTGDKTSNAHISLHVEGMARAARNWKKAAAVGGDGLEDMRYAFSHALADVADGRWYRLASPAPETEDLRTRLTRWVRRVAALTLLITVAVFLTVQPFPFIRAIAQSGYSSVVLVVAALAAHAIDPTMVERLSAARTVSDTMSARK